MVPETPSRIGRAGLRPADEPIGAVEGWERPGEVVVRRRPGSGRTALLTWAAASPPSSAGCRSTSSRTRTSRTRPLPGFGPWFCVAAMSVAAAVALGGLSLTSGAIGSPWIREGSNAVDGGLPHLEAATNLVGEALVDGCRRCTAHRHPGRPQVDGPHQHPRDVRATASPATALRDRTCSSSRTGPSDGRALGPAHGLRVLLPRLPTRSTAPSRPFEQQLEELRETPDDVVLRDLARDEDFLSVSLPAAWSGTEERQARRTADGTGMVGVRTRAAI